MDNDKGIANGFINRDLDFASFDPTISLSLTDLLSIELESCLRTMHDETPSLMYWILQRITHFLLGLSIIQHSQALPTQKSQTSQLD
jgi:hypothetical protein